MAGKMVMVDLLIQSRRKMLIEYVKNQKDHHKKVSFREEYINLLNEHGIEFDEKYLF